MKTRLRLAKRWWLQRNTAELNERLSMELSGVGDSSDNSYAHRGGESKKPHFGVLGRNESNN